MSHAISPATNTPASLGYRMPAEWERHEATWLAWPQNPDTWPGKFAPVLDIYVQMVRALHQHERIHICTNDAESAVRARGLLSKVGVDLSTIHFHEIPTNDVWTRDYGPIFITRVFEGRNQLAAT